VKKHGKREGEEEVASHDADDEGKEVRGCLGDDWVDRRWERLSIDVVAMEVGVSGAWLGGRRATGTSGGKPRGWSNELRGRSDEVGEAEMAVDAVRGVRWFYVMIYNPHWEQVQTKRKRAMSQKDLPSFPAPAFALLPLSIEQAISTHGKWRRAAKVARMKEWKG
jgi:hypothetical protein